MYTSNINIKHNRSTEIHWGVHKLTGELIWIDDVEGNGYACNCKCAYCGSDLIACTHGEIQRHHFKHRGNNGCYYSDEIAEYLKAKEILSKFSLIWVPPITVRIGNRPQMIQDAMQLSISRVYCSYDSNHYPPLLVATSDARPIRIILSFDGYYKEEDYKELIIDARKNNWDCLEILLPTKGDGIIINEELFHEDASGTNADKRWIFNSNAHDSFVRLKDISKKIPPISARYNSSTDKAYECPLHKRKFNNNFFAFESDCEACDFWLDFHLDYCRCLAEAYIKELSDLDIPENVRREHFIRLQKENEIRLLENNRKKIEETSIRLPKKSDTVENTQIVSVDSQLAKECFCQQLCPCCGKHLRKQEGKKKNNWLCLHGCDFFVVEDIVTGEIKMIHKGKDVR